MNSLNTKPPRITVIIVTRNRKDLLKRSLLSLQNNLRSISYLLIIDNSSSDGSQAMIKKEFPNAILIENTQNLGFGRANNLGLQYMQNQNLSTDWILLLNDDAYFEDNSIQTLFESLENKTSIQAAIPAVVHEDGRFQIGIGGSDLSLKSAFFYFFGFSHLFPSIFHGFYFNQNYFFKYFQKKNNLDSFSIKLILLKLIFLAGFSLRRIFHRLIALFGNAEAKKRSKSFKAFNRHIRKRLFKPASK